MTTTQKKHKTNAEPAKPKLQYWESADSCDVCECSIRHEHCKVCKNPNRDVDDWEDFLKDQAEQAKYNVRIAMRMFHRFARELTERFENELYHIRKMPIRINDHSSIAHCVWDGFGRALQDEYDKIRKYSKEHDTKEFNDWFGKYHYEMFMIYDEWRS